ncbi:superoxide dismutase [Cu-Zn], chloroplastic [Nilaparvata lugens]|uniref:superoxide dismutase [Cu-Zn], chloroplastic n=1 Tax=Nilaparvata lugens TaxID=108931 RepID=UPI00193D6F27|nr:superoxide dismutase [Cu-Zn], chloroplastic [Nilaparvata lugens]
MATCKSVLSLLVLFVAAVSAASEERKAIAVLKGDAGVTGNVTFTQVDDGPVTVTGIVTGLSKGNHGFHIHEKGDISMGCTSTKGHFNPEGVSITIEKQ